MELDKRILPGKRPLSCLETEEAKQFIGKEGYFTDVLAAFTNMSRNKTSVLTAIDEKAQSCFKNNSGRIKWDFFLPAEWVKPEEPENKWRPFKDHAEYKEFLNDGIIESWVKIKEKSANEIYELMYVGGGGDNIILGNMMFSVSKLFRDFELFNECAREWLPFGVEEASE